jgi:hypothetical protein
VARHNTACTGHLTGWKVTRICVETGFGSRGRRSGLSIARLLFDWAKRIAARLCADCALFSGAGVCRFQIGVFRKRMADSGADLLNRRVGA